MTVVIYVCSLILKVQEINMCLTACVLLFSPSLHMWQLFSKLCHLKDKDVNQCNVLMEKRHDVFRYERT
jgi:hypothetical protein